MKVINPTDSAIEIQYKGVIYSVEGNDSVEVPEEAAVHWKTNLHNFLILEESAVETVVPKVKEEEVVETVTEETEVEEVPTEEVPVIEEVVEKKSKK